MATIHKLCALGGPLEWITVPLGRKEFKERHICGFPEVIEWMKREVPSMATGKVNATLTPHEQLDDILRKWITGKPMKYDRWIKDLMPGAAEVWEMKTSDLRIFGWIYRPYQFIAVLGGYADDYKKPGKGPQLYDLARDRVIAARNKLDIDPPKFLPGAKFHELV